jgi:hypothetical protein
MTLEKLLEIIRSTAPSQREAVADKLIKQISEDERPLADAWVGEFIATLNSGENVELLT